MDKKKKERRGQNKKKEGDERGTKEMSLFMCLLVL